MVKRQGLLASAITLLALLGLLLLPGVVLADKPVREHGKLQLPRNATESYTLTVGNVSVTIPAGALPGGGPVILKVWVEKDGRTYAEFQPDRTFALPVMIDFGSAATVYFHNGSALQEIVTSDLDGDGEPGEIWSLHFSRYSGWF